MRDRLGDPALAARLADGGLAAEEVGARLVEQCEGNFLYATKALEAVERGHYTFADLGKLPGGLASLYEAFFDRLFPEPAAFDPARRALEVIVAAREPLVRDQLAAASGLSAEDDLPRVLRVLAAFLPVSEGRVRVFHKSLSDWLTDPDGRGGRYAVSVRRGDERLADAGLAEYRRGVKGMSPYSLRHLGNHLVGCARLSDAQLLLADIAYLDARAEAGQVEELASEFATVFKMSPEPARRQLLATLEVLGRSGRPAMGRVTTLALVDAAGHDPAGAGRVIEALAGRPARGRGAAVAQANVQAARVAMDVCAGTARLDAMQNSARRAVLAACAAGDSTVRSLAVVAVFRLAREAPPLGIELVRELARRSVWCGLIRPRHLEVFAGCALGLFYDRIQDAALVAELRATTRGLVARILGLRLAVWLAPKVISVLWSSVPDEMNCVNLPEIREYKRYAAGHPELVAEAVGMADWIDPAHGTPEEFAEALRRVARDPGPPEAHLCLFTYANAAMSRAIASDESALEATYEAFRLLPADHQWRQEFMFRMRIIQVGNELTGRPPLGPVWTERVESATRDFMYHFRGIFPAYYPGYLLGGITPGVVFVANQLGHGRLRLLDEFVAWALGGPTVRCGGRTARASIKPTPCWCGCWRWSGSSTGG